MLWFRIVSALRFRLYLNMARIPRHLGGALYFTTRCCCSWWLLLASWWGPFQYSCRGRLRVWSSWNAWWWFPVPSSLSNPWEYDLVFVHRWICKPQLYLGHQALWKHFASRWSRLCSCDFRCIETALWWIPFMSSRRRRWWRILRIRLPNPITPNPMCA